MNKVDAEPQILALKNPHFSAKKCILQYIYLEGLVIDCNLIVLKKS